MREIKIKALVPINLGDVYVGCSEVSEVCSNELQCEDCPFNPGSNYTIAEIIREYTVKIAKEAPHE